MGISPMDARLPLRFWSKVRINPVTGCWEWFGYRTPLGYGRYRSDGRSQYAHRVAYAALSRPLVSGQELHHVCEVPSCCNPEHLLQVTRRQHQKLTPSSVGNRTECPYGHTYTPENTRIEVHSDGGEARRCLTCERARGRKRRVLPPGESNFDRALTNVCKHGHDLRDSWIDRNGTRKCRACNRERARARRATLLAAT